MPSEKQLKYWESLKGRIGLTKGRHWKHSEDANIKKSKRLKGKMPKHIPDNTGRFREKNGNWKGGITPLLHLIRSSFKYRQWRSDCFTRDDYTCQLCSKRGNGRLEVDHIKSFRDIFYGNNIKSMEDALNCEELWNINNGRTLCFECHRKTDNYGTWKKKINL